MNKKRMILEAYRWQLSIGYRQADILKVMMRRYLHIKTDHNHASFSPSFFICFVFKHIECWHEKCGLIKILDDDDDDDDLSFWNKRKKYPMFTLYLHRQWMTHYVQMSVRTTTIIIIIITTYAIKLNFIDRLQFVFDVIYTYILFFSSSCFERVYFIATH